MTVTILLMMSLCKPLTAQVRSEVFLISLCSNGWRKVSGIYLRTEECYAWASMSKDGWWRFSSYETKTPLTHEAPDNSVQALPQTDTGLYTHEASTFPLTPSYHPHHRTPTNTPGGKGRIGHSWTPCKASKQTFVTMTTASHTHMCQTRGRGSWVTVLGLNGPLCVIIQNSSNPGLKKVGRKNDGEVHSPADPQE